MAQGSILPGIQTRPTSFFYQDSGPDTVNYNSKVNLILWNAFGQVSKNFFDDRLVLSLGLRMDANNYTSYMSNMLHQVSPRFSPFLWHHREVIPELQHRRYITSVRPTLLSDSGITRKSL